MSSMWNWLVLLAATLVVGGCAEERGAINRVQPNALHKSFFVGEQLLSAEDDPEFYSAATVIDVPYGTDGASTFDGLVGSMHRIKWEITEDTLNARLTYEKIEGVDGHGSRRTNNGQVIAAYAIASHFDIRHAYNPTTGEELNVIEENSTDRAWFEREYFRVDWSSNLVTSSFQWDPMAGDGLEAESLSYYVSDPNDPDAPVFDIEDGYFDITNKLHLKPKMIDLGFGEVPACFFRGSLVIGANYPWGNCQNSEVTVRYSFRMVPEEGDDAFTDFQPTNWDGSRMTAMGVFTVQRLGWDRNYGIVDDKFYRFAQRYNIWQRSHSDNLCATPETFQHGCDPNRDDGEDCNLDSAADGVAFNGTADECEITEGGGEIWGSRCSELVGKCTLPFSQRELRPVAWHYTVNAEDDQIFDSTQFATWEWDSALRVAVQAARYEECVRTKTASLINSPWEKFFEGTTSSAGATAICQQIFPIDQTHDDAEIGNVRDTNVCMRDTGDAQETCASAVLGDKSVYETACYDGMFNAVYAARFTFNDGNVDGNDDDDNDGIANAQDACPTLVGDADSTDGCPSETAVQKMGAEVGENCTDIHKNRVAFIRPMVVLCHSPVTAEDDVACGGVGTAARPGDIRFHQVNMWPTRQSVSPWGYGPSLSDPLTGEIISAGINVYNAVTDSAAQSFLDQIRWINGEISYREITSGQHVHDWIYASNSANAQNGALHSQDELDRRVSGIAGLSLDKVKHADRIRADFPTEKLLEYINELNSEVLPPNAIPEDRSTFEKRIHMAKESGVEADLLNPMWLQMAGVTSDMNWEQTLDMASPLRGMNSHFLQNEYKAMQNHLASMGQCMLGAPEPTGIPALAKVMEKKFPYNPGASVAEQQERLNRMWDYLRWKMNFTVILHEMGHTVGLRHNFVSSYDRFNFRPQYWQLRTKSGTVTEACDGPQMDGENCVGPRYYDPITDEEADNSIWTFQQTSVMDYAGDVTQDMLGLGVYDMAAARMFYGDVMDVVDHEIDGVPVGEGSPIGTAILNLVDNAGYLFGQFSFVNGQYVPYAQWGSVFDIMNADRCTKIEPKAPSWWNEERLGPWDPIFDGNIVNDELCSRIPVDYVSWDELVPDVLTLDLDPQFYTPRRARDIKGRPRVPYGFGSDEYADGWSPSGYRHDNGADMYEEIVFHSNLYENRHIFDNFRNGRVNFTVYGAYQRALSRYHAKIGNLTQGFGYTVNYILREFAKTIGASFADVVASNAGPGGFLYDHAVAAAAGFDHFARVMTRPHVGRHFRFTSGDDRLLQPSEDVIGGVPAGAATALYIPNGNLAAGGQLSFGGRPVNNDFQYGQGYWTIDYLNQIGSYYEKTYAAEQMLQASYGSLNFSRLDGLDARYRHTNFTDLFPEGTRRMIGLMLTEDYEALAPRISSTDGGLPDVTEHPDDNVDYPTHPLAWVSFVPEAGPVACAPVDNVLACVDSTGVPIANGAPTDPWYVSPQLGYEVQKFIVFWFYVYQPVAETNDWVDMARIYQVGSDANPEYLPEQIIEWRDPESGLRYFAKRFGDETIFGKIYDRGIAAKMIQWANTLTAKAYELDEDEPFDPVTGAANFVLDEEGQAVVRLDPTLTPSNPNDITCEDNRACIQLRNYRGLLDFTRSTAAELGFPEPSLQIFGD